MFISLIEVYIFAVTLYVIFAHYVITWRFTRLRQKIMPITLYKIVSNYATMQKKSANYALRHNIIPSTGHCFREAPQGNLIQFRVILFILYSPDRRWFNFMVYMEHMYRNLWNRNKNTNKDMYKSFTTKWRKRLYWSR